MTWNTWRRYSGYGGYSPGVFVVPASVGKVMTYRGSFEDDGGTDDGNPDYTGSTIAIGPDAADRYVLVGYAVNSGGGAARVGATNGVGGTTLTKLVGNTSDPNFPDFIQFHGGVVSSGGSSQRVEVQFAQPFVHRIIWVWTMTGLTSTTVKQTAASASGVSSITISAVAGDFMFALAFHNSVAPDLSGSTESFVTHSDTGSGVFAQAGELTVASTNASFSVTAAAINGLAAVTFS